MGDSGWTVLFVIFAIGVGFYALGIVLGLALIAAKATYAFLGGLPFWIAVVAFILFPPSFILYLVGAFFHEISDSS